MVVFSIRVRISWAVAIGKVLLRLMGTRTFVKNHGGFKTGYTEDKLLWASSSKLAAPRPGYTRLPRNRCCLLRA